MSSLLNNEHAWGESLVSSFPDNVQSDSLDSWSVVGAALWNALPSLSLTGTLGKVAVQDFVRALISLSRFLWQTLLQPILCVVWVLLQVIYHFLSQEQVWQQVRKLAVGIWQWERSLTLQQHVGQVVVVCTLVCLYKVYRYLERTQVVQRKVRQIKMYYRRTMAGVARTSIMLAIALPHIFAGISLLFCYLVAPSLWQALARKTPLSNFLLYWYPLIYSIWTIHDVKDGLAMMGAAKRQKKDEDASSIGDKENAPTQQAQSLRGSKRSGRTPLQTRSKQIKGKSKTIPKNPANGRQSEAASSTVLLENLHTQLCDWNNHWTVVLSLSWAGRICMWCITWVPFVAGRLVSGYLLPMWADLKLGLAIWMVLIMPQLTIDAIITKKTSDRNYTNSRSPLLQTFANSICRWAHATTLKLDAMAVFSKERWDTFVSTMLSPLLQTAVMVRLLSQRSKDWVVEHAIHDWRTLWVPLLASFLPFVGSVSVWYAQFLLVFAKLHLQRVELSNRSSSDSSRLRQPTGELQFWILRTCLSVVIGLVVEPVVRWFPGGNVLLFVTWWFISLSTTPSSIQWYASLEREFKGVGLVNSNDKEDEEPSFLLSMAERVWNWVPKYTPKDKVPPPESEGEEELVDEDDMDTSRTEVAAEDGSGDDESQDDASDTRGGLHAAVVQ